ncbi:CocE/NonD family hydrolase [Chryseobacterium capnotolerans]|uniref:CocE/NonD family hydrolase n=1 Tax=Chryseobacterium TaxID=59732 RepID=UPI00083B31DE|nr:MULTISPECIES: CocE/NonD family hydrolase [Chryseobacterium]UHO39845.1 CocE/NonD family hydrolase [Chryseobacterium capnotolerans]
MKFKILLALIFANLIQAQKFHFPKTAVTDTLILEKQMPILAVQLIPNLQTVQHKPQNTVDVSDVLFRLQIIAKDYQKSLATLTEYRNQFADHNMAGYKFMSYEIYSMAKLIETKISFSKGLRTAFDKKYESLPEHLLPRVGLAVAGDVNNFRKLFKKALNKQKGKDSIDYKSALALCKAYLDYKTYSGIQPEIKQLLTAKDKERFITETKDLKIQNGNTLTLTIIRKKGNKSPLPVILTNNIYAGELDRFFGTRAATYGYIGLVVNTRGKRNSNDENNPFEHESQDLYEVIDWASKQPWSNGKVGMIGGSYLGFSQWAAVKKLHPALKTIVPQVSVGIGIDYPARNNVFMSYMLQWIQYVTNNKYTDEIDFNNAAKWDSINTAWYKSGSSFRSLDSISKKPSKIFQRWLDHPGYDQYWQKMVPYKEEFAKINIPILTTTGYYDDDQIGALYYYNQHLKYNKNAEHYLVIGPYNHGGAQSFGFTYVEGSPIDPAARISIDDLAFSWFDYILKNGKKPELLKDKVNFQVMNTNSWKHVSSFDKMHTSYLKFYLQNSKNNSSVFSKPTQQNFTPLTVDFNNRNDKDTYYAVSKNDSIKTTNSTYFVSEVLDKDIIISGSISGFFTISTNKKDFDTNASLYEIRPDGKLISLSSHIARASYAKNNETRQLLTPNTIEQIPIKNAYVMSKKIEKGSKLLLLVGVNKNPNWQLNYGTGKDVSDETIQDAGEPMQIKWYNDSYVEIPVY